MKNYFFLIVGIVMYTNCFAQLQLSPGVTWKSSLSTYVVLDNLGLKHDAVSAPLDNIFKFSGNTDATISGSNTPLFTTIELAKNSNAKLVLQQNISATSISFQSGLIDLNNYNIDLGTTGQLNNETDASHITGSNGGYIQIVNTLNAPNNFNAGNLGAIISSSQNLGSVTIRRGHVSQRNGSGLGNSVLRYFDISPTNNSSLNATLRFAYFDSELNGLDENSLVLWKSENLTSWSNQGYNSRDNQFNYVEKNSIDNFSRWTLSAPGNPLPLVWSSFNTQCINNHVVISWKTFAEQNTKLFIIQKSVDGSIWTDVTSLTAAGSSNSVLNYSYTDVQSTGNTFFRVMQLDMNGQKAVSPTLRSNCETTDMFLVYPNPTSNQVWVSLQWEAVSAIHLLIYDAKGSLIKKQNQSLQSGTNTFSIDFSKYVPGNYTVVIADQNGKIKIAKIEKK